MAWKFLSIGKANSEIERLNKELEAAKAANPPKTDPPAAAAPAEPAKPKTDDSPGEYMDCEACNGSGTCAECMGNGKCAECGGEGEVEAEGAEARAPKSNSRKLAAQVDDLNLTIQNLSKKVTSLENDLAGRDADIKTLNEKLAAKDGEVKVQVSRQVVATQAALGQPAAPAIPATATTTTGNGELKGVARLRAGIKTELDKNIPPVFPPRN